MTGDQMIQLRKRLGTSQPDFASLMERGKRMIQKYEAGDAEIPRVVALACAALALGLTDYPAER
jgi:DNA-binding transcriptional regulator YiaG